MNRKIVLALLLFVSMAGLQAECLTDRLPRVEKMRSFNEFTLGGEGEYFIDVDFDGVKESVRVVDGDVMVRKLDAEKNVCKDVSHEMPYCMIRAHACCDAHAAYTTFNYTERTVYIEAHYGCCEQNVRQFKKIGNGWMEVRPIKPLSILQANLRPVFPVGWIYYGSYKVWNWSF